MTEVILRPARLFDAAPCAAIVNDWIDSTPWLPRVRSPAEIARLYRERMIPNRRVTMAEVDREVAGFLALDQQAGEITSLFVGPKGRGIGAALLAEVRALGQPLNLWTFQANEAARRFYLREGLREGETTDGQNEENLPDVQYLWGAP